jgi:phosphoketolase
MKQLESWLRSYRPEELFDETGRLIPELRNIQIDCQKYAYEYGVDKPEIDGWRWK